MSTKYRLGPDIDLDAEAVKDRNGRRITEADAQKLAEDAIAKVLGRPSLGRPGTHSPEVKARVPEELRERLNRAAEEQGTTASHLIREALERYLAG